MSKNKSKIVKFGAIWALCPSKNGITYNNGVDVKVTVLANEYLISVSINDAVCMPKVSISDSVFTSKASFKVSEIPENTEILVEGSEFGRTMLWDSKGNSIKIHNCGNNQSSETDRILMSMTTD